MKCALRWISLLLILILCVSLASVISYGADGAPEISYAFSTRLPGRADGTVTVKTDGYSGENYTLCWGTADGILQGYLPLTDVSDMTVSKNILKFTPAALTAIPAEATHLWVTLDGALLSSYEIPEERRLTVAEPSYTFGVVSDIHFGSSNAVSAFESAMDTYSAKGVSFVLCAGDNTCGGTKDEWDLYASTYAPYADIPLWFVLGNHDALAWNLSVSPSAAMKNAKSAFPNYANENHSYGEEFKVVTGYNTEYDYSMEYEGDLYLFMGIGAASNDSEDKNIDQRLSEDQLDWLEECLAEYYGRSDSGKVFLIFHYYTLESGMSVRGHGTEWDKESSQKLHSLLNKYPGVIYFNGHTHYSFDGDRNSYSGNYAFLHVPSLSYGGLTDEGEGQEEGYESYLVEVYDGYVLVKGMNVLSGQYVACASFCIADAFSDPVATYGMTLRTTASGAIQWRANGGESNWTKLTTLSELKTDGMVQSIAFSDGKTVDFRANETHMQWKLSGDGDSAWADLVELDDIPKTDPQSDQSTTDAVVSQGTEESSGGGALVWITVVSTAVILCVGALAVVLILRKNKRK